MCYWNGWMQVQVYTIASHAEVSSVGSIPVLCKSISRQAANWYSFNWCYTPWLEGINAYREYI